MAFSNSLKTCSNSALRILKLDGCPLGDEGAKFLSVGLEGNKNLRHLRLNSCQITDVGMRYLSEGILKSTLEDCKMYYNEFEFRCQKSLKKLFHPTSPLKNVQLSSGYSLRSSELKPVLDSLAAKHNLLSIRLPREATAIFDHKEQLSDFIQNNSCLRNIYLREERLESSFTEDQKKEMTGILVRSLMVNHSLVSTDLLGYGDTPIEGLLDLNRKGVIAAAAGKGVPLPSAFVKGMVDAAVPKAVEKVGEKGGLTGIFSFLKQIHFGNASRHRRVESPTDH